jgi:hypothetical protein
MIWNIRRFADWFDRYLREGEEKATPPRRIHHLTHG